MLFPAVPEKEASALSAQLQGSDTLQEACRAARWPPPWGRAWRGPLDFSPAAQQIASNSLWPQGLQPTRLLCVWDFPGKNTGVGCHTLLQGIFPTQGLNPGLPLQADSLQSEPWRKPNMGRIILISRGRTGWKYTRFPELHKKEHFYGLNFMYIEEIDFWLFRGPMDCSLPSSSVHGILQARILESVAMPSSRGIFPTQG